MGRKHRADRHPGFICFTCGIFLTLLFFSGCSMDRMARTSTAPVDNDLKHHLDTAQEWIEREQFQSAADANQTFLNTNRNRFHTNDTVMANYLKQARIIQTLYDRILSDTNQIRSLKKKLQQNKGKQHKNDQAVNALESEIQKLMQKAVALEKENTALKKQIQQMKQIDLDPGYKIPSAATKKK